MDLKLEKGSFAQAKYGHWLSTGKIELAKFKKLKKPFMFMNAALDTLKNETSDKISSLFTIMYWTSIGRFTNFSSVKQLPPFTAGLLLWKCFT